MPASDFEFRIENISKGVGIGSENVVTLIPDDVSAAIMTLAIEIELRLLSNPT